MSSIVAQSARARLTWPKQHTVEDGGGFNVYDDQRDGSVNYGTPLNATPIDAWPSLAGKIGFLEGLFLGGAFLEGDGGFGFLDGRFLEGAFLEGDAVQEVGDVEGYLTTKLTDGDWIFGIKAVDAAGNESTATEETITIAGVPEPASDITASLDGDNLTIGWTLSTDDT